jgi:hypothetical protein
MNTKRTHVVLSEQAAEQELMRRRQVAALKAVAGAWKNGDHPELRQGSDQWVRKLRREGERRSG